MKTYLAAPFALKADMVQLGHQLEPFGYVMTARWYHEHQLPNPSQGFDHADNIAYAEKSAREDLADINAADLVIVMIEPGYNSTHGQMVELGYALALCEEVWIVGAVENIFCVLQGFLPTGTLVRRFPTREAMWTFVEWKEESVV